MSNQIFTVPNIISLSRLVLAWPIAYSIYHNQLVTTAILGSIAIISDFFDGYLSRKLNQTSQIGKVIDPIVDGILVFAVMVALSVRKLLPLWYIKAIIIRYALLVLLLSYYRIRSSKIPGSIASGKYSMCAIALTITTSLFQSQYPALYSLSLWLSTGLLFYSFCDYIYIYLYEKN